MLYGALIFVDVKSTINQDGTECTVSLKLLYLFWNPQTNHTEIIFLKRATKFHAHKDKTIVQFRRADGENS